MEEFLYSYDVMGFPFGLLIGLEFVHHCSLYRAGEPFNGLLCSFDTLQWLCTVNMCILKAGDVLINIGPLHFYPSDSLPSSFWHKLFEESLHKGFSHSWVLTILHFKPLQLLIDP